MPNRASDRSTPAEAKITKWLTTKAKNEPQESKDEKNPEQRVVCEKNTEIEVSTLSTSTSKQTASGVAENPKGAHVNLLTEPNQF